ncbi:RNA polymerase sigma-70 factor [Sinomicrobium sp. M5D2P17]
MKKSPKDILYDLKHESNEQSFEIFFSYYYNHILLWANSIVKDPDTAKDIVQDFFLDFWQKKRYLSITSDLSAYVFRTVRNSALKHVDQKKKTVSEVVIKDNMQEDLPYHELDRKEIIYTAINSLPDKCREVFTHCCIYGKTYGETAEDLGVSINTVRTHMTRAFKLLRERLHPSLFFLLLTKKDNFVLT